MADLTAMMQAAAGAAGDEPLYIEDVFSTYLYTGNGSTQTITNNIDLAGKGGLVWMKSRNTSGFNHALFDTVRGTTNALCTNNTNAQETESGGLTAFNANGFTLGSWSQVNANDPANNYCSWTFREQAKFFDVVTYTGNGSARTIAHNLGSVPGSIWVKRTDTTGAWQVYHRANTANPETDYLVLNTTAATADSDTRWNDTLPTSTEFSLGTDSTVNANTGTYVAYLFAHDAGGFGTAGTDNVISCGSYTGNGSESGPSTTLGYEPQWVLIKRSSGVADWVLFDNMRGMYVGYDDAFLRPNTSVEENTSSNWISPNATGFQITGTDDRININGSTYIYIAIRRPMKPPTSGTSVFGLSARSGTGANATVTGSAGVSDAVLVKNRGAAVASLFSSRLTGTGYLVTSTTAAEVAAGTTILQANPWDVMDGVKVGDTSTITNATSNTYINYLFDRAPGFFDVVCYTGTGTQTAFNHNLTVVPELVIIKKRDIASTLGWVVGTQFTSTNFNFSLLNSSDAGGVFAYASVTTFKAAPTTTTFTLGTYTDVNASASTYVAYLFATVAGVSKVGTYTGNGSSVTVTTGFQPRFILVKRTDSTGNWIVGDSARGLVAGDDPFFLVNTDAAETTNQDWVDVSGTGFTVNETGANANVSTATYIFLAIS